MMSESSFPFFTRRLLDPETPLMRISKGELGGKASGLATIRGLFNSEISGGDYAGINLEIPSLAVLCTDTFDAFMQRNDLYEVALSDLSDARIAQTFQRSDLPFEVLGDLRALINQVKTPLAVRSSSLLEDAKGEPFAGIYATKMVPNNSYDPDIRFRQLVEAIKFVYASTFCRSAKDYRLATGYEDEEEKMAVILQEVVGKRYYKRFYPELSGVARSYNYYPMGPARAEDGVVSLALGLGKTIVDGGRCWTYSPAYPMVPPPFGSDMELIEETQNEFWAINMGEPASYDPILETEYLLQENLMTAERDGTLQNVVSTYNPDSGRLSAGTGFKGQRALTFAPILALNTVPLNDLLTELLRICEVTFNSPVEIEFAMTFDPPRLGFLQVRGMEDSKDEIHLEVEDLQGEHVLVATQNALGNGVDCSIRDIVYTNPEVFCLEHSKLVVPELERMNRKLLVERKPYLLIALGRLGTTDPWLGIPINWGKISGAKVVVEATQENIRVDLSQGSHYFHNIVSLGVMYFTLSFAAPHRIDWDWMQRQEAVEETRFLRHVRLPNPLEIKVDGKTRRGAIYCP
jgi:hypothetical protein